MGIGYEARLCSLDQNGTKMISEIVFKVNQRLITGMSVVNSDWFSSY